MPTVDTVTLNTIRRVLEGTVEVTMLRYGPGKSQDDILTEATQRLMGDLSRVLDVMLPRTMTDEHYEALDDVVSNVFNQPVGDFDATSMRGDRGRERFGTGGERWFQAKSNS